MTNNPPTFEIIFHPDVEREYARLDNTRIKIVDKALEELESRADEIGKPLGNHQDAKLAGCKEIKLRDVRIRIVFRVTNEVVHVLRVVYILTIERRDRDFVFRMADRRLAPIRKVSRELLRRTLKSGTRRKQVRKKKQ